MQTLYISYLSIKVIFEIFRDSNIEIKNFFLFYLIFIFIDSDFINSKLCNKLILLLYFIAATELTKCNH